jgi:hypothetical protein
MTLSSGLIIIILLLFWHTWTGDLYADISAVIGGTIFGCALFIGFFICKNAIE